MPDPAAPGGAVPHQAERKLVTVLLAEVDEAVTTWSDPDPEDVEQSLTAHVARVQAEVERFGGVVEQRVGSRALGVFGLPRTHDDDPERAVQAALAIRRALAATQGTRVRVTVATGRALVRLGARGAAGAAGQRVLGDPITTCARLLEVAPPDAVLVTEATVRASERAIAYGPAGMVTLHSGEPAAVWSPLDPDGAAAPGPPRRRSPPLVARGAELGALLDELTAVLASRRPRLVTVLGQAGIGKSRLLAELAAARSSAARSSGCSAGTGGRPPRGWPGSCCAWSAPPPARAAPGSSTTTTARRCWSSGAASCTRWRPSDRWCWRSRTRSGRTPRCWTSSRAWPTRGRSRPAARRCWSSSPPALSSGNGGPAGPVAAAPTAPPSSWSRSPRATPPHC